METVQLHKYEYLSHTIQRLIDTVCRHKYAIFLVVTLVNLVFLVGSYNLSVKKVSRLRPESNVGRDPKSVLRDIGVKQANFSQRLRGHERLVVSTVRPAPQEKENLRSRRQHTELLQQQRQEERQKQAWFDCETLLSSCEHHQIRISPVDSLGTRLNMGVHTKENLTIQQQQQLQQSPYTKELSHHTLNISRWCGRVLQRSDTSDSSFTLLSEWLSSGGVNVINLLHRSVIPCSLECPASGNTGSRNLDQKLEFSVKMPSPRLSQTEMDMLKHITPVEDDRLIANGNASQVTLLSSVSHLRPGSVIRLRVDLYDGYGKTKTQGGDEIRVWIFDPSIGAGSPGKVYDLNNGSYLANVTVRWSGGQKIAVALHHPREIMRTMLFLRHALGTMRYLTSAFENGQYGQVTPCMWYPIIPGYDDVCDLTSLNGGLPWFCGKPGNGNLTCADWVRAQASDFVAPLPVTRGEKIWLDKMNREPYVRTIPFVQSDLTVTETSFHVPSIPCWRIAHSDTWKSDQPSGWFYKWKWHSAICNNQDMRLQRKQDWLKNTSVYLLGDSNMKNIFKVFRRQFCTVNAIKELPFPGPMNCSNPELGIRIFFRAHAHPFNLPHPDHYRKYNKPLSAWLDQIHHGENVLIVCHLYLHFSQFTIPLYDLHVQDVFRGVQRLLHRNPGARVVIRGTHVAYKGWPVHAAGGDVLAYQFNDILKKVFAPLHDRLMYLDGWDMTLAVANLNFHPEPYVDESLVDNIFNHFVGR